MDGGWGDFVCEFDVRGEAMRSERGDEEGAKRAKFSLSVRREDRTSERVL